MKQQTCKILFVKPPAVDRSPQATDPPLAFLYLSAYLKTNCPHNIEIELLDLRLHKIPEKDLAAKLVQFKPDIIGISVLSADRKFLENWAKKIKGWAPGSQIVIGGPCATCEYDEILPDHPEITCAIIGEGEISFANLVIAYIKSKDIRSVNGIAWFDGNRVIMNAEEPYIEDLNALPLPDYSLLTLKNYWGWFSVTMNGVLAKRQYAHVVSSRACPYNCIYCHNIFGKKVRRRSPENFVSELEWLYDTYGVREFHIVDDIFNIDRKRMHDILNLIIKTGKKIKIAFPNGVRGDLLDKKDIDLMHQAGVYMLTFAIETASPRMQKIIRKNLDIQKVVENIDYATEIGLITRGFFMLGFPGETVAEIKSTIRLAAQSRLHMASFFTVIPFRKTGLAAMAEEAYPETIHAIQETSYWQKVPFYQRATGYNLKRTQRQAYLRFYLPFRLIKTFLRTPRKLATIIWFSWAWQIWSGRATVRKKGYVKIRSYPRKGDTLIN